MKYMCKIFVLVLLQELSSCVGIVDDYRLNVTSSGPAVYGSVVTFEAQLYVGTSKTPEDKKLFRYEWRSTVDMLTETQQADYNTSLHRCFDSYVDPRKYQMRVAVYDLKSKSLFKPVADKELEFVITSKLNGNLKHNQTVHRRSTARNNTFSTEKPVGFLANLTDDFRFSPNFTYKWYINNKLFEAGNSKSEHIPFQKPGYYVVRLDVDTSGITSDCKSFDYSNKLEGSFRAGVRLKDPVKDLRLSGKTVVDQGENTTLYADFSGTAPFLFCWKLFHVHNSSREVKWSCENVTFLGSAMIRLSHKDLKESGKYALSMRIENDISLLTKQNFITVNEVPTPHHSSHSAAIVVLPVVSAVILVSLLLLGGVMYNNYRKKQQHHIESADFQFHRSIQKKSNEGWFWSNIKDIFRSLLSTHDSDGSWERINSAGRSGSQQDQNRRYGTMVSPVEA